MGTYLFFASGARPNDRASRPRTIPIAAQLRKPSRTFVQSGFNEVALTPAIRATLCHATSQNPPDSKSFPPRFDNCACDAVDRLFRQHRPKADNAIRLISGSTIGKAIFYAIFATLRGCTSNRLGFH